MKSKQGPFSASEAKWHRLAISSPLYIWFWVSSDPLCYPYGFNTVFLELSFYFVFFPHFQVSEIVLQSSRVIFLWKSGYGKSMALCGEDSAETGAVCSFLPRIWEQSSGNTALHARAPAGTRAGRKTMIKEHKWWPAPGAFCLLMPKDP